MVDVEGVLLAAFGFDQHARMAFQRAVEVVYPGDVQLDAAERSLLQWLP